LELQLREDVLFTKPLITAVEREALFLALESGALRGNSLIGIELEHDLFAMLAKAVPWPTSWG
jgi:hypothetical protein